MALKLGKSLRTFCEWNYDWSIKSGVSPTVADFFQHLVKIHQY